MACSFCRCCVLSPVWGFRLNSFDIRQKVYIISTVIVQGGIIKVNILQLLIEMWMPFHFNLQRRFIRDHRLLGSICYGIWLFSCNLITNPYLINFMIRISTCWLSKPFFCILIYYCRFILCIPPHLRLRYCFNLTMRFYLNETFVLLA